MGSRHHRPTYSYSFEEPDQEQGAHFNGGCGVDACNSRRCNSHNTVQQFGGAIMDGSGADYNSNWSRIAEERMTATTTTTTTSKGNELQGE